MQQNIYTIQQNVHVFWTGKKYNKVYFLLITNIVYLQFFIWSPEFTRSNSRAQSLEHVLSTVELWPSSSQNKKDDLYKYYLKYSEIKKYLGVDQ